MKQAFVGAAKLAEIVARHPTPFHLYDEAGIRAGVRRLRAAFAWAPAFREYFAVKATPTPAILRILLQEGCGLDCSSYSELLLARAVGCAGADVMFSSNMTPDADFRLARGLGATVNLDDESHLPVLEKLAGLPEELGFRLNPGPGFASSNAIMDDPAQAKYGLTPDQLRRAVAAAMAKGVRRFGLHAFLASNTLDGGYYVRLAELLFRQAAALAAETGARVAWVNLSGGLGIPYRPEERPVDIEAVGRAVAELYAGIVRPAGLDGMAVHTELGRWVTGPHGCLVATVIREKRIWRRYLGLDACAADLLRPAMYGAYHHISLPGKEGMAAVETVDVAGGLCENNDKFAVQRALPPAAVGDLALIHDTGAHGRAMGYNYNGKLRCGEVLLQADGGFREIRRAETPADYLATVADYMDA